ncbi:MAG: histidine phosphatase family protein [Hyphomicrobiales bacterium]|nr:histidine phosphatase family protein [Hyphomicrobiales bacterium]
MTSFPHRLIFVRHGETAYNAENRLQGQLDIPLNARGREQARTIGGTLRRLVGGEIDRLEEARAFFASPLERARETMEIARGAMGLTPQRYRLDPVLKEMSFGVWEGLTWSEIESKDPKGLRARREHRWAFVPEGGESYAMLADRLRPWIDSLNEHAFVISHGGVARVLMALIAGIPPAKAVRTPIIQGRAIVFEHGGCRWIG